MELLTDIVERPVCAYSTYRLPSRIMHFLAVDSLILLSDTTPLNPLFQKKSFFPLSLWEEGGKQK